MWDSGCVLDQLRYSRRRDGEGGREVEEAEAEEAEYGDHGKGEDDETSVYGVLHRAWFVPCEEHQDGGIQQNSIDSFAGSTMKPNRSSPRDG